MATNIKVLTCLKEERNSLDRKYKGNTDWRPEQVTKPIMEVC